MLQLLGGLRLDVMACCLPLLCCCSPLRSQRKLCAALSARTSGVVQPEPVPHLWSRPQVAHTQCTAQQPTRSDGIPTCPPAGTATRCCPPPVPWPPHWP